MKKTITEGVNASAAIAAGVRHALSMAEHFDAPHFRYEVECYDKDGNLKWVDGFVNLVTTAGGNDLLTQYFKGSAYTAAWYVGLIDNAGFSAVALADTASSHGGWTESTAYSNGTRPALTLGTAGSKSIDNSASKASFSINASATINGAFTITNSTKGGTTGVLYSAGSFSSARAVSNGDTLQVQITLTV